MLRIKYQNTFLTLATGSTVEMERNSPLFSTDVVLSEFSMPITIVYNESNAMVLGDLLFDAAIKQKAKLDVEVYDGETYRFRCTLVVDKSLSNSQSPNKGSVQGYLLHGSSDFFTIVKDLKMVEMNLGGSISFNFTTWNAYDNSNGFWQHVHQTWSQELAYAFIPIRNESWIDSELYSGWMNQLGQGILNNVNTFATDQIIPFTWVVPQPRLYKVLEILFEEVGWTINFSGLNDLQYKKIMLLNINPIKTTSQTGVDGLGIPQMTPMPVIKIEIRKMFSPEVLVKDFILQHCKRYGWAPIFNNETRTCYLTALKEVSLAASPKDFSKYASSEHSNDFSAEQRKFSFKNSFSGNDESINTAEFTNYSIKPSVFRKQNLPAPSPEYDTSLIPTFYENAYWKIEVNDTTNQREWQRHSFNIFDEEIKGSTDTIETTVTSVPALLTEYCYRYIYVLSNPGPYSFFGLFLYCKIPRNKEWGLRNYFYHGLVADLRADNTGGGNTFPYASNVNVLPTGIVPANSWSNVYIHKNGATDYGIINYWFKEWTAILKLNTPIERKLYLPLYELGTLNFLDIILILNQPYLLIKYVEPIPYKGYVQATLHPIVLNSLELIESSPSTGEITYVRFIWENETDAADVVIFGTTYWTSVRRAKPIIRCYFDAAGLVPKVAIGLKIYLSETFSPDNINAQDFDLYTVTLNAQVYNLATNDLISETYSGNNRIAQPDEKYQKRGYSPSGSSFNYTNYRINTGAGYIVL